MRARGLTLLEVMIALAILAIIATLALPTLAGAAERARLKSAAETLAADLAEARFESARRGQPLTVEATVGPAWCWVVATDSGCPCGEKQACRLKAAQASDFVGIAMSDAHSVRFDPTGTADTQGGALFQSSRGEQLRVDLLALGRARICAPQGALPGYPAC